jgi:hypothetical protein
MPSGGGSAYGIVKKAFLFAAIVRCNSGPAFSRRAMICAMNKKYAKTARYIVVENVAFSSCGISGCVFKSMPVWVASFILMRLAGHSSTQ